MKWVNKRQDLQSFGVKLNEDPYFFQLLEVVCRGSETQLQVHGWKFKLFNLAG